MRAASPVRRILVALTVAFCLLGATAVAVALQSTGTVPPVRVASVAEASPEPDVPAVVPVTTSSAPATSTTTTTPARLTSTTTSAPTSTPATVKAKAVATPATAPPATAPPPTVARVVTPTASSPELRCAAAIQWVNARGLALPSGWGYRCPGVALVAGAERWGVACWNCAGPGSWIAVDIGRIGDSDAALHYVVAHETCHANDYALLGLTTEVSADLCAALHGAPRP